MNRFPNGEAPSERSHIPNVITVGRIASTPFLFFLILSSGLGWRFVAFVVFVVAGLTDVWDGYLARKHGWVTDAGKLLDPLADKLLMLASFVPIYLVSQRPGPIDDVPWWGPLPLWVLLVIFGRELLITLFRQWAQRRGRVIAAGKSGKYKTLFQSLFVGGVLLWLPLVDFATRRGWTGEPAWRVWSFFHRSWVGLTLGVAVFLTVYSMVDYLWGNRSLFAGAAKGEGV